VEKEELIRRIKPSVVSHEKVNVVMEMELAVQQNSKIFDTLGTYNKIINKFIIKVNSNF
jgi:hypothetical protein